MEKEQILRNGLNYSAGGRKTLHELRDYRAALDSLTRYEVRGARRAGLSWQEIGDALGISKQLAHQRYRDEILEPAGRR